MSGQGDKVSEQAVQLFQQLSPENQRVLLDMVKAIIAAREGAGKQA